MKLTSFFFLLIPFYLLGQNSSANCETIYKNAEKLFKLSNYQTAIKKLAAYKICANSKQQKKADSLLIKIYQTVDKQRLEALKSKEFAEKNEKKARQQEEIAIKQRNKAQANYLISEAKSYVEENPTIALSLAEEAYKISNDSKNLSDLKKIYGENEFYKIINKEKKTIETVSIYGNNLLVSISRDLQPKPDSITKTIIDSLNVIKYYSESDHPFAIFSPSGKFFMTGGNEIKSKLWDLNGNIIKKYENRYSKVCFSNNDGLFIGIKLHEDKKIFLCELNGEVIDTFEMPEEIISIAFSHDSKHIVAGLKDGNIYLINLSNNSIKAFDKQHTTTIYCLVFSPNDDFILSGSYDKNAILWNFEGKMIQKFTSLKEVYSVAFSPNGKNILVGSSTITMFELNGNILQHYLPQGLCTSIAFSPNCDYYYSVDHHSNSIKRWKVKKALESEIKPDYFSNTETPNDIKFLQNGKAYFYGTSEGKVYLKELDGKLIREFYGHTKSICSVATLRDSLFLTSSEDNTVKLWNKDGKIIKTFQGHKARVKFADFLRPSKIISFSFDKTVRIWGIKNDSFKVIDKFPIDFKTFSFNNTNMIIGGFDADNKSILMGLNGKVVQEFIGVNPQISSTGNMILTIDAKDRGLIFWKQVNNHYNFFKKEFLGNILDIYFSKDGKMICVTFYSEDFIYILDGIGDFLYKYEFINSDSTYQIQLANFSYNNSRILLSGNDGSIKIYRIPNLYQSKIVTKNIEPLTKEQKKQYNIE